MNETLEQRQATMRRVIQHIIDKKPYDELSDEDRLIAKECVDKKYIKGVVLIEMATGKIVMEIQHDPVLTEAGAAFLSNE